MSWRIRLPGSYDATIEITSPLGCQASATFFDLIEIYPLPNADFTSSPNSITNLQSNGQLLDQSVQAIDWLWTFPDGNYSTSPNPEFTFPDSGDYPIQLQVWNTFGCRDSVTKIITVTIENRFFLPNAFAPNGDGKNDVFQGVGFLNGIENFQIKILNRWGEIIFQSQNPEFIWDGADAPKVFISMNGTIKIPKRK